MLKCIFILLQPDGICPVTGETALTAACSTGNAAIADALLIRGATPYSLNARQMSPLALAAKNGRTALVLRLLDSGADVMGSGGKNPLTLAAAEGHTDVIDMLLAHGQYIFGYFYGGPSFIVALGYVLPDFTDVKSKIPYACGCTGSNYPFDRNTAALHYGKNKGMLHTLMWSAKTETLPHGFLLLYFYCKSRYTELMSL